MVAIPILTNSIPDQEVVINTDTTSLNLFDHFDDPFTTGLVARFELFNPENTFPNEGVTEVVLFDQADEGAPLTIENFTNYVEDGDYVNSIIHRSVADFVIQGGGFFIDESPSILAVPTDDPVQNEFSSDRSNLEGTIAMAKLGNDPDSATSQWFFNLGDNSENLDNQNGGFTAFGELLSDQDAETVNTIAELPPFNLSEQLGGAFNTVPINIENPDNPPQLTIDDFVRYESITISQQEELEFTVTNNSNPELVEAAIEEGELILNYLPDQTGEAEITVQATNLVGETVEDSFSVTVEESLSPQPQPELLFGSSTENDTVEVTDAESQNLIFVGAGEDTINNSSSPTSSDRFYGGTENDQLILGGNDRAFGGEGNDILDASISTGNNRLYGGIGDDVLAVSRNDRAFGGEGNDTLFLTSGGGNILFGGAGNDTFVINSPNAPQSLDTINDFSRGEDQIAFSDDFSDVDFDSLRITPTANGEDTLVGLDNALVRLAGIQADTLTEADFDFTV
ncbi:peptidylprolyl isomerase [Dactylococcopsis salina]|uniref:peptidylprolyl isomerase n=1 Tax=Dactylococcopsis salina (strain PCC 8305) TaxID=13035 RepID=K9YXI0_DACS8|nr:peptidylprolyl isomerase [Dactylococcopsis salina]AFZ51045.1 peptidyl-prolyl cis-trans isomerase (rotamase) - cyclophilin family [Dactylococcopsis salina PCC 8305]